MNGVYACIILYMRNYDVFNRKNAEYEYSKRLKKKISYFLNKIFVYLKFNEASVLNNLCKEK